MKKCAYCGEIKPVSEFAKRVRSSDGLQSYCRSCNTIKHREYTYRSGKRVPHETNPDCPLFLGVHVAEKTLSKVFKNVQRAKMHNPGFDFICGRGYKIDVKSSCRITRGSIQDSWIFHIRKNKIADYFLCIAFDNRNNLNPEHLWLIPGEDVNNKTATSITESNTNKWSKYELNSKLEKVIACCNVRKT